jgi:hypothetical protein
MHQFNKDMKLHEMIVHLEVIRVKNKERVTVESDILSVV